MSDLTRTVEPICHQRAGFRRLVVPANGRDNHIDEAPETGASMGKLIVSSAVGG